MPQAVCFSVTTWVGQGFVKQGTASLQRLRGCDQAATSPWCVLWHSRQAAPVASCHPSYIHVCTQWQSWVVHLHPYPQNAKPMQIARQLRQQCLQAQPVVGCYLRKLEAGCCKQGYECPHVRTNHTYALSAAALPRSVRKTTAGQSVSQSGVLHGGPFTSDHQLPTSGTWGHQFHLSPPK
jgi:hypothetical protein